MAEYGVICRFVLPCRLLLRPFLCDLGRLLLLSAAGACLEEDGYTDDWDAYVAYCELREAMPDATVVTGRLLRTCMDWWVKHYRPNKTSNPTKFERSVYELTCHHIVLPELVGKRLGG